MDTDASCNVLHLRTARKLGITYLPKSVALEGFDSSITKSIGMATVEIKIDQKKRELEFQVVSGGNHLLIGKRGLGMF